MYLYLWYKCNYIGANIINFFLGGVGQVILKISEKFLSYSIYLRRALITLNIFHWF